MNTTETEVQTRTRREEGFAGFKSNVTTEVFEPEFKPFTYGTETQETAFEVEKQYNFDANYSEVSSEKTNQIDFPTVQRNEQVEQKQIVASKTYVNPKINTRGKIMISVYSIIVAIIVAFCIYNAVSINSLQTEILLKSQIVAAEQGVISDLEDTYNSLGEEENILNNIGDKFKDPTDSDIKYVEDFEFSKRPSQKSESNWFERFCENLRKLFS